jgi:phosphoribosylformylglycinamidine synthase I
MKPRICIIQFPGVNCEDETKRAAERAGLSADIVRSNAAGKEMASYDGFILPGGFSYEDRVRAGAIAASEDVTGILIDEASKGKPILGICNGAQVLVESGLIPQLTPNRIDLALAPNRGMGRGGYYSNWVFLKAGPGPRRTAATYALRPGEILPIPIAHSQGRFTSSTSGIFDELEAAGQIVLKYCRPDGGVPEAFPDDPNGSERHAAAISNVEGNVVAMMPHPERSSWLRQVPPELKSEWSVRRLGAQGSFEDLDTDGPGARIFRSLRLYIEERP